MRKKWVFISFIIFAIACSVLTYNNFQRSGKPLIPSSKDNRFERGHNVPGKLYWAGSAQDKMVALTFDDGPESNWTPKILDILKTKNVKATFFVIGQQVQQHPDILQRMDEEGHIIGNHTFSHRDLTKLDAEHVEQEIDNCALEIQKVIGKEPRFVRPPFGFHSAIVDDVVYSKDRIIILWSLDTKDWTGLDAETIKSRILPHMQNGYIVLQHDGSNPKIGGSVQALPEIIDGLKAQGYTFVTISELLDTQPYK
ncbi:polysaccharide deacetylase family protein [Sporomusa rhizae]|uniref:polysaccharide deacetylase family protein n=1 Tax=Sporomusa rhizae TaxID=357999 RepID=UPI00352B6733